MVKLWSVIQTLAFTDATEQKKAAALSFNGSGLYISLRINMWVNYRIVAVEEFPGLTTIIVRNGCFDLPISGKQWREFAGFVFKFADNSMLFFLYCTSSR